VYPTATVNSVTGASDNVCSENTLLNNSSNILTADQKLRTEAPPKSKSKPKTKLPPQKKGLITFNRLPPKYTV